MKDKLDAESRAAIVDYQHNFRYILYGQDC